MHTAPVYIVAAMRGEWSTLAECTRRERALSLFDNYGPRYQFRYHPHEIRHFFEEAGVGQLQDTTLDNEARHMVAFVGVKPSSDSIPQKGGRHGTPWRGFTVINQPRVLIGASGLARRVERFRGRRRSVASPEQALHAAADWLARAHDATPDDGVAANYDANTGQWAASYPETTGYIIPTLFRYAELSGRTEFRERAIQMAAWESHIQFAEGGVRAGTMDADKVVPTIFNTGQVLFGWAAAWEHTDDKRFRHSLKRAADWLVDVQDEDGAWRQFASPFAAHTVNTYNTRVAFGLVRAAQVLDDARYRHAAQANVEWALTQARDNGWLDNNDLEDNDRPLTHTVAYAIRGILEVGLAMERSDFVAVAQQMAGAVAETQQENGSLPGRLDEYWRPAVRWSCLTGNAQMAIIWQRLAMVTGESKWRGHARRCIDYTLSTQDITHADPGCCGGIAGSWPRGGGYMRWRYPNWAAKFFMDAVMSEVYS